MCKKKARFPPVPGAQVDPARVMEFLAMRGDRFGPVSELLDAPEDRGEGWFRCRYRGRDGQPEPTWSARPGPRRTAADWQRAWHGQKFEAHVNKYTIFYINKRIELFGIFVNTLNHGQKFEALYSILYLGRLVASWSEELGHRFFPDAPGVYVHKDGTGHKAENYIRFVPLCRDGVFWAAVWEVRVDRSDHVTHRPFFLTHRGTDQWIQPERSVRLEALWLCGRRSEDMTNGSELYEVWNPILEAHPLRGDPGPAPPVDAGGAAGDNIIYKD